MRNLDWKDHAVPPGLAELKQLHMELNNECSQHLFIEYKLVGPVAFFWISD